MKQEEFVQRLQEVQDLMNREKYLEALNILAKLKEVEKTHNFNYDLVHKLYQLDSNTHSLYNQQIILDRIKKMQSFSNLNEILLDDLKNQLSEHDGLDLEDSILHRELELLILRGNLSCYFDGNKIRFE
ncbi:MAG: hypothetical protein ACTSRH_01550 [Promethearchaeota archaeon]